MPRYNELHRMLVWGVPHLRTRPLSILELGVGTGNLTGLLAETFPHAKIAGVDISPAMIAICRKKTARWGGRLRLTVAELDEWPWEETFDVIVSCLAVHHLSDERKAGLFRRVHGSLSPGGYFGDGDDHLPEDSRFDERFSALAGALVTAHAPRGIPGGLQKVWHDHEAFDRPVTVSSELTWLREAGFVHLDTPWRFFNQAVIWAYR